MQVLGTLDDSASVIMTQDLTSAQVVVATTSKLRSSPKVDPGPNVNHLAGLPWSIAVHQNMSTFYLVIPDHCTAPSPQMKSVVRKLGVPIYTIRSTSTSSIYRDLCPLLGLDPLTAVRQPSAEALKAAAAMVGSRGGGVVNASGSYDSSASGDEEGDLPVVSMDEEGACSGC